MKDIILHGCYHTRNFGDLLMLDMIGRHIQKSPGNSVSSPWIHPDEIRNLNISSGNGLRGCFFKDAAILGGGGYFVDEASDKRSTQRLLRYLVPAAIWRLTNTPYQIIGVGVGPELTLKGAKYVKFICDGAQHITVRDDDSKEILIQCGVPADKLSVTADFVIGLEKSDIPESFRLKAKDIAQKFDSSKRKLGLHLSVGDMPDTIKETAHAVANGLQKSSVQIVWLFDHAVNNLELINEINSKYFPDAIVVDKQEHWTTAALLSELDAVLTTKLHVGITAWALGVPPCSLANHGKTKRFYSQIERSDYHINISDNKAPITDWIKLFSEDYERFKSENPINRDRLKKLSKLNFSIIDSFLSSI